ncbi:MAG TPA: cobalamin-dependent protein, partial [Acidimicrobiales bacterium]|nr:cobalamin-dependent protein [Acidimicrobiales bacterium]
LHTPEPSGESEHVRVVLGKKRFDAHDVGARYIMRKLVDAGMEVVFIRFALIGELVDAAVQEDAEVIGLSVLTGGHLVLAADLMEALREAGLDDRLVVIGGVIADEDHAKLHSLGVDGVFGPGSKPDAIVAFINDRFARAS